MGVYLNETGEEPKVRKIADRAAVLFLAGGYVPVRRYRSKVE